MKMLTRHQPWASLIAVGAKSIETRGWSTDYRGPLAIHAAKKNDVMATFWLDEELHRLGLGCFTDDRWTHPPLGAVVAVCDLVDVVPTDPKAWTSAGGSRGWSMRGDGVNARLSTMLPDGKYHRTYDWDEQAPFGDFTPGRYAWLLDSVYPLTTPIPARGHQGLRDVAPDVLAEIEGQIA